MLNAETEKKQKKQDPRFKHPPPVHDLHSHKRSSLSTTCLLPSCVLLLCISGTWKKVLAESERLVKCASLMHRFFRSWLNMCSHSRTHHENGMRVQLPVCPRWRMSQPDPGQARTTSVGWDLAFSRPVTGDYPGVVGKCCPDGSRMLFYQRNT